MQLFVHVSQHDKYSQHKILISKLIKLYSLNDRYMMSEVPYFVVTLVFETFPAPLYVEPPSLKTDLRTSDLLVK